MHSVRSKSSRTSLRPRSSVLLVSIGSSDEMDNVVARFSFQRSFATPEDSSASFASERDGPVFANQPGTFPNSDYGCVVLLQKLNDPFLLWLAQMPRGGMRIL